MPVEVVRGFSRNPIISKVFHAGIFASLTLLALAPQSSAQFRSTSPSSPTTISGSVLVEGTDRPAGSVRVDIRSLTGSPLATTYTDSGGRFEATSPDSGAYIVTVDEQGYEPVEQRVDRGVGTLANIVVVLKKVRTFLPVHSGYTVSVKELNIPGKARKEFEKGAERLQKQDYEGGLAHFKEATNAYPDYYEAFYQAGLANMELRRWTDAEQDFQRAINLTGGGHAEAEFALGAVLCQRQAYVDAERAVRRGLDTDSNSWKGYIFMGEALFGQNRLDETEKNAREAILRKPDASSAYILLANVHIRRHQYVMALSDLDTYLKLKPTGPTSDQARDVRNAAQRVVARFQRILTPPRFVY
jgi:Tfp pilus assembly protein PilF